MSDEKTFIGEMISSLKQQRDEIALKIHLGEAELKEEWERLNDRLVRLSDEFKPFRDAVGETSEGVAASLRQVGEEIKQGFDRIRKSL